MTTNTKISLIHIISGDLWAGAESQVYNTLLALKSYDDIFVSCVLFNNGILKSKLDRIGIQTHVLDETKYNSFEIYSLLRKIVKTLSPNIIHVHHVKEHLLGFLSTLSHVRNIRIIRTVHGKHGVRPGLPAIQRMRSTIVVYLDTVLTKYCSKSVIAVSKDMQKYLYFGGNKSNNYLIYNSIDIEQYISIQSVSKDKNIKKFLTPNTFWIGTAARLVEPKNLKMLIDAGHLLNNRNINFQISIFGDGPLKSKLQEHIIMHNLQNQVKLHGFTDNMLNIINSLDAFVLCSSHEGLPMALLEAMLLETPVICTRVGGMKEVIEHETNGILIKSNDVSGLTNALERLCHDQNLCNRLGKNAKQTVIERFSTKATIKKLIAIYRNAVFD